MRTFVVVLVGLVSATAALNFDRALSDHVHDPPLQPKSTVKVYGSSDINFQMSQEKYGIKALLDMPFVLVFKDKSNNNELFALRLGHGLQTLWQVPELSYIVDAGLRGVEYAGLFLSAARTLDLLELKMPVVKKSFFTPLSTGVVVVADDFDALPWVYFIPTDSLPAGSLDKLLELGEFTTYHDKIVLEHDILAEQAAMLFKPIKQEVHPSLLPMKDAIPSEGLHPINF